MVRFKTAKLFEAAACAGALLAQASTEQQLAASTYGRHLGTAFQLIDDLLDYSGNPQTLGKTVGDDLREGKPTLPLLRVLSVGTDEQKELIRSAIATGDGYFEAVAHAIQQTDALEHTRKAAEAEIDLAIDALSDLPDNEIRVVLQKVAGLSLRRDN